MRGPQAYLHVARCLIALTFRASLSSLPPVQAIDPAQFQMLTKWVAVSTRTPSPVANFVFRSECWNGGYEGDGAQVDAALQDSILLFGFADQVGGRIAVFRSGSSGNIFAKGETGEMAARESPSCLPACKDLPGCPAA